MIDPGDLELATFHLEHAGGNASSADVESLADTFAVCREEGAAALFGLIEMAKAIRQREVERRLERLSVPGCYECMDFGTLPNAETCACGAASAYENGNCAAAMTKHPEGVPCPKCQPATPDRGAAAPEKNR